jgi:hypothetical protein
MIFSFKLKTNICPTLKELPVSTHTLKKRFKREYRKMIDKMVRSHAFHKMAIKLLYFICFVISVILGTLLYLDK